MKDKKRIIIFIILWAAAIITALHSALTYPLWGRNLPFNMKKARNKAEDYLEGRYGTDFTVEESCAYRDGDLRGYRVILNDANGIPAMVVLELDLSVAEAEYPLGNYIKGGK